MKFLMLKNRCGSAEIIPLKDIRKIKQVKKDGYCIDLVLSNESIILSYDTEVDRDADFSKIIGFIKDEEKMVYLDGIKLGLK